MDYGKGNKIIKTFKKLDLCCKFKCCQMHSVALQKLIFDDFYSLGDSLAQDQVLLNDMQIT